METTRDMIIRISPGAAEITVEQNVDGVICRKTITPETLGRCVLDSRYDDGERFSGILPDNCVSVAMSEQNAIYFIRYPELYADISYYGTEYERFPIPRLVFSFRLARETGKVMDARLCVVKDERLTPQTPTFTYPFSNVYGDNRICLGNNALPAYKDPTRIFTLANFILRMPNNNDMYRPERSRLKLGYRELLEHLKDKEPAYYYTNVLISDGQTFQNFLNRR